MLGILHLNNYDYKGGAETIFNLTKVSQANFKNYSGYVRTSNSSEMPDINFRSWEKFGSFRGIINYIFSYYNYKLLKQFLSKHKISIIHIHGFFSSLSPSILLAIKRAKLRQKVKVVQTLHDFHLICPNASLYNFNKNSLCEKCISKTLKLFIFTDNCDKRGRIFSIIKGIRSIVSNNLLKHKNLIDLFIVPSDFLKKKILEEGISSEKIEVIRNPISLKIEYATFKKENIICYFGRFSIEKNLQFLIKAFSSWKSENKNDFLLYLIGDGSEIKGLKELADNSSCKDYIHFIEFLPFNELANELKRIKYHVLTSICYENAPLSILEAAAYNIISVVPNIGGMKESVEQVLQVGKTYIPDDIISWKEKLNYLEENYQEEISKLIKFKNNSAINFSSATYSEKMKNLYIQLCEDI